MTVDESIELTHLLQAARNGERVAIDQLFAILYPKLRDEAHKRVPVIHHGATLDTTSLVHESYLRLVKAGRLQVESRQHFLSYAAHVMRSVVVDFMRSARAQRRGGGEIMVTLNSAIIGELESSGDEITALSDLLDELAKVDARLVNVVEMRYFASMESIEIAQCLGVTDRTIRRDLEKVRLLLSEMGDPKFR